MNPCDDGSIPMDSSVVMIRLGEVVGNGVAHGFCPEAVFLDLVVMLAANCHKQFYPEVILASSAFVMHLGSRLLAPLRLTDRILLQKDLPELAVLLLFQLATFRHPPYGLSLGFDRSWFLLRVISAGRLLDAS
jgi:hypothetical protein